MKFVKSISANYNHFCELHEKNSIEINRNDIISYYKYSLHNGLDNKGKSSPKEFLYFIILNIIIGNILYQIEKWLNIPFLLYGYLLLISIPFINLWMRRLNDISRNKYWLLLPILSVLLVVLFSSFIDNFWVDIGLAMLPIIFLGIHIYWSFLPGK